jgi:SAM-dependent methyltransferase
MAQATDTVDAPPPPVGISPAGLPSRYATGLDRIWRYAFDQKIEELIRPGVAVLDAGSGRAPAIARDALPTDCSYVGLDISSSELDHAGPDAYDETWSRDLTVLEPALEGRFDFVISLFLLEHVRPIDAAIENMRLYLKPGGTLIAQFAGGRSVSGWLNRLLPHRAATELVRHLTVGRSRENVFPAHYDRCFPSALLPVMTAWSSVDFKPQYTGATHYFDFADVARRIYLGIEDRTLSRPDAATWYLMTAVR